MNIRPGRLFLVATAISILGLLFTPAAAAYAPAHVSSNSCVSFAQLFSAKEPPSTTLNIRACVTDGANTWNIHVTGMKSSYTITGALVSSSYLAYTPWPVSGSGSGRTFTWTNHDPNPSDPNFCSWTITASVSGPTFASGTWVNLGCGHETGTISLFACGTETAAPATTSQRPGEK